MGVFIAVSPYTGDLVIRTCTRVHRVSCVPDGVAPEDTSWERSFNMGYNMVTTIIGAPKVSEFDANMELSLMDLEDALEEQVMDYFSDWEIEDLDEKGIGGRLVLC